MRALSRLAEHAQVFILLKEKRAELGSDKALAKILGKSGSYVTRLLSGERPLPDHLVSKLMQKIPPNTAEASD